MQFKDHFSEVARDYARARPAYPAELFKFLAEVAPARKWAWDCATGSGQAAIGLSEWFEEVQATDASPDQIAQALQRPNITYSVQLAEKTRFADKSFDLVNVATALHWFDLDRFYAEVQRVLRPRGLLAVYSYRFFTISPELDRIIHNLIIEPLAPYWPPESRFVREGYKSLDFPFTEIEIPVLEMRLDWSFDDLAAYLGTWSALRNHVARNGSGPMRKALADVAGNWGDPERERRVTIDLVGRAGHLGATAD